MGKQPSADERRRTVSDELMSGVRDLIEKQRAWLEQRLADVMGYSSGALEQLMYQQGQMMTVQAAIIEYLEELAQRRKDDVGAEVRIRSLVEQNIAKAKAERAAAEKRAADVRAADVADQKLCTRGLSVGGKCGDHVFSLDDWESWQAGELKESGLIRCQQPIEPPADIAPDVPAADAAPAPVVTN